MMATTNDDEMYSGGNGRTVRKEMERGENIKGKKMKEKQINIHKTQKIFIVMRYGDVVDGGVGLIRCVHEDFFLNFTVRE